MGRGGRNIPGRKPQAATVNKSTDSAPAKRVSSEPGAARIISSRSRLLQPGADRVASRIRGPTKQSR